jgi:hypothetical protein
MVLYKCKRCNYTTHNKSYFRKHLKRKIPCIVVNENVSLVTLLYELDSKNKKNVSQNVSQNDKNVSQNVSHDKNVSQNVSHINNLDKNNEDITDNNVTKNNSTGYSCKYCGKIYSHRQSKHKHEKNCKENIDNKVAKVVAEEIAKRDNIISELRTQMNVLMGKVGETHNHNNITNYNTYNIILNAFGKENTSYLSKNKVNGLIERNGAFNCIPKLLKYIHFNPEHVENRNITIPNTKQAYAKVFDGEKWVYQDKKLTIDAMTDKALDIINIHYNHGNQKLMDKLIENYEENDKDTKKKLYKNTELMILNNKNE